MTLPITNLRVTRFRSLREVRIGPCGRVNLITGRNNSGKSSVLEAIRVLATEGSSSTLMNILTSREELAAGGVESEGLAFSDSAPPFSSLFSGFPDLRGCGEPFTISNESANGELRTTVSVHIGWSEGDSGFVEGRQLRLKDGDGDFLTETPSIPVLVVSAPSKRRLVRFDQMRTLRRNPIDAADGGQLPCVFLDPSITRTTAHLASLWDGIALTPLEGKVVEALQIISPDIEAVSVIGSDGYSRSRMAIVRSRKHPRPLPLRTFGDGLNRLFGIILSLCSAKGGVLVVDEIENGLHHSISEKVWETVFHLARSLDVQVFATTHSWDCIEGFQKAAAKDPEDGVLIRMTNRDGIIIPTLFREDELAIAAREQIEMR
jgi:hypothetical protein